MYHLPPECFWELLHIVKTQRNIAAIVGHVGGAEDVVPDAEGKAEVHAVAVLTRKLAGMMPDVHLGIIKDVFQWAEWNAQIGMIEVTDDDGEDMHDDELIDAKADECEWKVLDDFINHIFHPVIAQVCSKAHLLHRVVDFMKFPKPRNAV